MKFPVETRKYMRWALTIKVWYENPSMKCTVSYGLWSIDLPRHIDELRSWLRWVADFEETKRLYKIITMEVNDMLREYYLNYNCSGNIIWEDGIMAEQFHFLTPPRVDTVINTYNVQNGQVHIMSWATPMELTWGTSSSREFWVDRYEPPSPEYLSLEEFEEKKRNWELRSWRIYCVLN